MAARGGGLWPLAVAVAALAVSSCSVPDTGEGDLADLVPADVADRGVLLVATDPTFPPAQLPARQEFQGVQSGPYTGFEVELVEAAASRLGLEVQWVDVPFADVLTTVTDGEVDMGAASITVTDERAAEVDFVTFFATGTQWAAAQPNTLGVTPNNACGARVAVQAGTVQEEDLTQRSARCEQAGRDPIDVRTFERQDEATAAVLAGVADAFVADQPVVTWAIQQAGTAGSAAGTVTGRIAFAGSPYDVEPYGWAFDPQDSALAEAMLAALQDVAADGDYLDILDRWGVADGALPADELVRVP
jgi:polar amino acid transport system substrate-binding protein